MDKINKLTLPATILIASIILAGFYYASEVNKQKSIEKQQADITDLKVKFLAECKIDLQKINHDFSNQKYFNSQVAQTQTDCENNNFNFTPDSPFQCYANLPNQKNKIGLVVMLEDSAYLDACIKYNIDLVKPQALN